MWHTLGAWRYCACIYLQVVTCYCNHNYNNHNTIVACLIWTKGLVVSTSVYSATTTTTQMYTKNSDKRNNNNNDHTCVACLRWQPHLRSPRTSGDGLDTRCIAPSSGKTVRDAESQELAWVMTFMESETHMSDGAGRHTRYNARSV